MLIEGYAAFKAKGPLKPFVYKPDELGSWDVEIKITHCGICHSDIHLIDDDWGLSAYPLVPGPALVGHLVAAGENVLGLNAGDRVGVGWQSGSCMACEWCLKGEENLCPKDQPTCVRKYGGFAKAIRTDSRFVFPIPKEIDSASAAPLLCGGITVYSPIR